MSVNKSNPPEKRFLFFAFLFGLMSLLFVPTPFGSMSLFDTLCFFLAPVLFVKHFRYFTRHEHCLLIMALLWLAGAVWSNLWRGEEFFDSVKGNVIVFSAWCLLVVSIVMLKKSHKTLLWFIVGTGISHVITLYYFQNASFLEFAELAGYTREGGMQDFLMEKQVYPIYINLLITSIFFPLKAISFMPWLVIIICTLGSAFFVLFEGGSRTNFGVYLLVGFFMIGHAYFNRMTHILLKNFVVFSIISAFLTFGAFSVYKNLAQSGVLGEAEAQKYEREMVYSDSGFLGSRNDIIRAWPFLKKHPIVGAGSSSIDRWGYLSNEQLDRHGRMPRHSIIVGSWVQNGCLGLFFWIYGLYIIFRFVSKRLYSFNNWSPFLTVMILNVVWAIFCSPFAVYRAWHCLILALSIVAQDNRWLERVKMDLYR